MEKIVLKTKIKTLGLGCRKQHIEFKAFDMTSRLVANVDKMIRNNDNEYIRLTINPESEGLGIEPIVSVVKLVAMECAGKGQHIKIAGFKASGDKLDVINQYINSESDVMITFEQTQEKLIEETPDETADSEQGIGNSDDSDGFDDNKPGAPSDDSPVTNHQSLTTNDEEPKDIEIKIPKNWGAQCMITIESKESKYRAGYTLKIGHMVDSNLLKESPDYDEANSCIINITNLMFAFIDDQKEFKHGKPLKKKIQSAVEKWQLENAKNS